VLVNTRSRNLWISPLIPGRFLFTSFITCRIHYVVHAMLWSELDDANKLFLEYNRLVNRIKIITVSLAAKDKIICYWGKMVADICCVIPNYFEKVGNLVDAEFLFSDKIKSGIKVLCIGTVDQNKRPDLFIEISKYMYSKNMRIEFFWVGDGPLFRYYSELSSNMPSVNFVGDFDEIDAFYENASVYLQLSDEESQGMAILGAMSYFLPCIVTNSGGPVETIDDGISGYIVPQGSIGDVCHKLTYLFENPLIADRMGRSANGKWNVNYRKIHWEQKMDNIVN
jgi:glycosyltransferase involved in cell wall biosynthesis